MIKETITIKYGSIVILNLVIHSQPLYTPDFYTLHHYWYRVKKSVVYCLLYGILANVLDCDNKFKLHSCYYIHFQNNALEKGMKPLITTAMG